MVEYYGNVFAATAFLQGLAVEEVDTSKLAPLDKSYQVIVAVRARKKRGMTCDACFGASAIGCGPHDCSR